jgi:hypothetical protein
VERGTCILAAFGGEQRVGLAAVPGQQQRVFVIPGGGLKGHRVQIRPCLWRCFIFWVIEDVTPESSHRPMRFLSRGPATIPMSLSREDHKSVLIDQYFGRKIHKYLDIASYFLPSACTYISIRSCGFSKKHRERDRIAGLIRRLATSPFEYQH